MESPYKSCDSFFPYILADKPGQPKVQEDHFILLVAPGHILLFDIAVA